MVVFMWTEVGSRASGIAELVGAIEAVGSRCERSVLGWVMAQPASYRDLEVWQKAMLLVESNYGITAKLPRDERFGLASQMQRAAVSVPCNIAEGYGLGAGGYHRHMMIARGSPMELEVQLELVVRLRLIERDDVVACWPLAQSVGQMLTKLALSLEKKPNS